MKIDLSPYYEWAEWLVQKRYEQKKDYKSRLELNVNFELIGILGEITYALCTGESFNSLLLPKGDGGIDFKNKVDIKTSEEHKAHYLIEMPYKIEKKLVTAENYVYVLVDLSKKEGRVMGWMSVEEFKEKHITKDFSYGIRMVVPAKELHPMETFLPYANHMKREFIKYNEITNQICQSNPESTIKKIEYLENVIRDLGQEQEVYNVN